MAVGEAYMSLTIQPQAPWSQGRGEAGCCESCQVEPSLGCGLGRPLCRLESESVWLVTNDLS